VFLDEEYNTHCILLPALRASKSYWNDMHYTSHLRAAFTALLPVYVAVLVQNAMSVCKAYILIQQPENNVLFTLV
jgi:hypothetical protein